MKKLCIEQNESFANLTKPKALFCPADFRNIKVLSQAIKMSVKLFYTLLVCFWGFFQNSFFLLFFLHLLEFQLCFGFDNRLFVWYLCFIWFLGFRRFSLIFHFFFVFLLQFPRWMSINFEIKTKLCFGVLTEIYFWISLLAVPFSLRGPLTAASYSILVFLWSSICVSV